MEPSSSSSSSGHVISTGSGDAAAATGAPRRGGFFRKTFQAMSDWGDEFERRHFEGDLKGALSRAPQKVKNAGNNTFKALNDWGDDFERRHFEGDLVGKLARAPTLAGAAIGSTLESVDGMLEGLVPPPTVPSASSAAAAPPALAAAPPCAAASSSSSSAAPAAAAAERPWEVLQRQQQRRRGGEAQDGALWGAVERLRREIEEERTRRRGRLAALESLAGAVRAQQEALEDEREQASEADKRRSASDSRAYTSERELAQLQERHHALLSRRASHGAELARLSRAAAAAEAAVLRDEKIRAEEGPRAWARAGAETEALVEAKLELAEVLCLLDEARLHRRRELAAMEAKVKATAEANERYWLASDGYVAPEGSFRKSLRQLWAAARG